MGHEVIGMIAYKHLTPTAKVKVDALLASDADTLAAPDLRPDDLGRQVDGPDWSGACFGFPALPAGQRASLGCRTTA
jgi:hypothetical protein